MAQPVKAVPDGYNTVTPYLIVDGGPRAIDFYKQAFDAQEIARFPSPDGQKVLHAELRIGDSMIYLGDEFPEANMRSPLHLGGISGGIHLYVDDVDTVFHRAIAAGATPRVPLTDMFWGDRIGRVVDPFGHEWALATHKEDLSAEEIGRRSEAFFSQKQKS